MAKNKNKNKQPELKPTTKEVVKMFFPVDVFYNDLTTPLYRAGSTHEIDRPDMVRRWLNRGAKVVSEFGSELNPTSPEPVQPPTHELDIDKEPAKEPDPIKSGSATKE